MDGDGIIQMADDQDFDYTHFNKGGDSIQRDEQEMVQSADYGPNGPEIKGKPIGSKS